MPYSLPLRGGSTTSDPISVPSSVCALAVCDDPAVVVLARADDLVEAPEGFLPSVLTSRLCATHARDAVDDLLRRACLGQDAPSLAITALDR